MDVFLVLLGIALAGIIASLFIDPKPWSMWGLPPRSPDDAEREYQRDELAPAKYVAAGLAGAIVYVNHAVLTWLGFDMDPENNAVAGMSMLVALWGAFLLTRWIEHRYRLRPRRPDEDAWPSSRSGSS